MNNNSTVPPPYILKSHTVFRCKVDRRMLTWPIIMWSIFEVVIFICTPTILWGIFAVLWSATPFLGVVFLFLYMWKNTNYVIEDNALRISSPLKTLVINIDSIKKIRRGKFWVERGRNFSASYIKLRIIYDRSNYIYVSPEDERSFIETLQTINPKIEFSSERGLSLHAL